MLSAAELCSKGKRSCRIYLCDRHFHRVIRGNSRKWNNASYFNWNFADLSAQIKKNYFD